uniref:Uncharacterized protein n=1 Tax=Arundo donax TaxID=35708 RepID=A0A0A8ZGC9_ARUDO
MLMRQTNRTINSEIQSGNIESAGVVTCNRVEILNQQGWLHTIYTTCYKT